MVNANGVSEKWDKIYTTSKLLPTGLPPSNAINIAASSGDKKLWIKWEDPGDTIIDGKMLCTWAGTKLVMKKGAIPQDADDGILLLDNQEFNKFKEEYYAVTGLENEAIYYFRLCPYSDKGVYNNNQVNVISKTPHAYKVMTVKVDLTNSDPEKCCTYDNNALEMKAGNEEWDRFFGHRPCLFKNGAVVGYLKPDDFSKFEDGTNADITSGNAGDVMIEFPRRGVKIETTGSVLEVSITDDLDNPQFTYYAHQRGGERREKFYLGAYIGSYKNNGLRSLSGSGIYSGNKTISDFRAAAQANGKGYEIEAFYQMMYIQCLYLLKYKNLNSQLIVGRGRVSLGYITTTGTTDKKGMDWGSQTALDCVKLFGIENIWANHFQLIDGVCEYNKALYTTTDNFNDYGTYNKIRYTRDVMPNGRISKVEGDSALGFVAAETKGSTTTYFCDEGVVDNGQSRHIAFYGGNSDLEDSSGIFAMRIYNLGSSSFDSSVGARLMYL